MVFGGGGSGVFLELLEERQGSFTCHCDNIGVNRTPNKSQHRKLTSEKKFCRRSCRDSNSQTFEHKSGALQTELSGPHSWYLMPSQSHRSGQNLIQPVTGISLIHCRVHVTLYVRKEIEVKLNEIRGINYNGRVFSRRRGVQGYAVGLQS